MFIYLFIIFINDKTIKKQIRKVINLKLIFYKDHNLFIYSKSIIIIFEKIIKKIFLRIRIISIMKMLFLTLKINLLKRIFIKFLLI